MNERSDILSSTFGRTSLLPIADAARLSLGFFAWYLVSNWVNSTLYVTEATHWWLNLYLFTSIALALLAVGSLGSRNYIGTQKADVPLALACGLSLGALLLPADTMPLAVTIALLSIIGTAQSWFFLRWGLHLSQQPPRLALGALIWAVVLVSVFKIIASPFPPAISGFGVALTPLASSWGLRMKKIPEVPDAPIEPRWTTMRGLVALAPTAIAIVAFFFMWSVFNMMLKTTTGHYSLGASASVALTVITHLLVVGLACAVAVWVFLRGGNLDFGIAWRMLYVLIALSLLVTVALGVSQQAQVVASAAVELGFALFWLVLADVQRNSSLNACGLLGFGGLLQSVPDWSGRAIVTLTGIRSFDEITVALLFFAMIAIVAFFLPHRGLASQMLLQNLHKTAIQENGSSISERCLMLGEEFGLTQREVDIIQLLSQGRTKPYIAETLFLSENTVRTYAKSAYRKLDIHSKQELLDLVLSPSSPATS